MARLERKAAGFAITKVPLKRYVRRGFGMENQKRVRHTPALKVRILNSYLIRSAFASEPSRLSNVNTVAQH